MASSVLVVRNISADQQHHLTQLIRQSQLSSSPSPASSSSSSSTTATGGQHQLYRSTENQEEYFVCFTDRWAAESALHKIQERFPAATAGLTTELPPSAQIVDPLPTAFQSLSITSNENNTSPSRPPTAGKADAPAAHPRAKAKVSDALGFLEQVKSRYAAAPEMYTEFLDIMKRFKAKQLSTGDVIEEVRDLFADQPDLLEGFKVFLPPGYTIPAPITHSRVAKPAPAPAPKQKQPPLSFEAARQFVKKVKDQFEPSIYKRFLEILHNYHTNRDSADQVEKEVTSLFSPQHPELIEEFKKFLPQNYVPPQAHDDDCDDEEDEYDDGMYDEYDDDAQEEGPPPRKGRPAKVTLTPLVTRSAPPLGPPKVPAPPSAFSQNQPFTFPSSTAAAHAASTTQPFTFSSEGSLGFGSMSVALSNMKMPLLSTLSLNTPDPLAHLQQTQHQHGGVVPSVLLDPPSPPELLARSIELCNITNLLSSWHMPANQPPPIDELCANVLSPAAQKLLLDCSRLNGKLSNANATEMRPIVDELQARSNELYTTAGLRRLVPDNFLPLLGAILERWTNVFELLETHKELKEIRRNLEERGTTVESLLHGSLVHSPIETFQKYMLEAPPNRTVVQCLTFEPQTPIATDTGEHRTLFMAIPRAKLVPALMKGPPQGCAARCFGAGIYLYSNTAGAMQAACLDVDPFAVILVVEAALGKGAFITSKQSCYSVFRPPGNPDSICAEFDETGRFWVIPDSSRVRIRHVLVLQHVPTMISSLVPGLILDTGSSLPPNTLHLNAPFGATPFGDTPFGGTWAAAPRAADGERSTAAPISDPQERALAFSSHKAAVTQKLHQLTLIEPGCQVLLLVVDAKGQLSTFATPKLQPVINDPTSQAFIEKCLSADPPKQSF